MQYTSNYHLSKPDSDDIINPTSRTGYNGNFDTLDTNLKSVSNKANTNESNIADLQAQTGEDIPFESGSADSISDKITNLDNSVGNKPSGETDTLWDKIGILSNLPTPIPITPTKSGVTNRANMGNSWYYKIGHKVHVHIGVQGLTANAKNEIFALPTGYRPYEIVSSAGGGGSTYSSIMILEIGTNGIINVHGADTYACVDIEYDAYN